VFSNCLQGLSKGWMTGLLAKLLLAL